MRPTLLDPFFKPITSLSGIGSKVGALFAKVLGLQETQDVPRILDLIEMRPNGVIDRRKRTNIARSQQGEIVTLELLVDRHSQGAKESRAKPYRVIAHDESAEICLTFFHPQTEWLVKQLPVGASVLVSGRMDWFNGRATMIHPDYIAPINCEDKIPLIEPVYGLTQGLSNKTMQKAMAEATHQLPALPEWLEQSVIKKQAFPSFIAALNHIHNPQDPTILSNTSSAIRRLAYDELLAGQISLALSRQQTRETGGHALPRTNRFIAPLLQVLPFALTSGQQKAAAEISQDLAAPERMVRLLQGDVGSGKTVVALLAMAQAAESGGQSALMAPTEVLARQHFNTLEPLCKAAGLKIALLTGREKGKLRTEVQQSLASGVTAIVVGTHALFQSGIDYQNLVLAVIDEQHRFGVDQRLQLKSKGRIPDLLVMTATPIPRTLVLAAFGDMDVSLLTEKPKGRKTIATAIVPVDRLDELVTRVKRAIESGEKVYWICPLVEESLNLNLTSALERFEMLRHALSSCVGLVHGRMKSVEKDEAMRAFQAGLTRLLVATTVVEVGVDVPDASIIIIEHAERYGLAQLHQLRGRVGRGAQASSCILLYKGPLSQAAHARLAIMRDTDDGFRIAEEDLRLRGEGELLGTKQSGYPKFKFADLSSHEDLLAMARQDARLILKKDSGLNSERGRALRLLLHLFRRHDAVKFLRSG